MRELFMRELTLFITATRPATPLRHAAIPGN